MYSSSEEDNLMEYRSREDVIPSLLKSMKYRGEENSSRKKEYKRSTKQKEFCEASSDVEEESDESEKIPHHFPKRHNNHKYGSQEQNGMQKVHEELQTINEKLQHESSRLKKWELELQRKETKLNAIEKKISTYAISMKESTDDEISKRCGELEKEYELKMHELLVENKKSRNSFKLIKNANDKLKVKVSEDEVKLKNYEEKQTSLQSRISNLQRKIELLTKQISEQAVEYKNCMAEKGKSVAKSMNNKQGPPNMFYETFSLLLQWIVDSHLKHVASCTIEKVDTEANDADIKLTNDRVLKVIIFMPNILQQVSLMNDKLQQSVLQFLYWSLLHQNLFHCPQKLSHSATYRRIGEELFQANIAKHGKENSPVRAFYRSLNYNIRILASLVILQSVNQADILVQVLQVLIDELKSELSKEFFLEIHGTEMLLPLIKLTNKIYLGYVVDILMVLIIDSPYMQQFLHRLSSLEWVDTIISLLKNSAGEITLMENLSLILQRLSKLKSIKPIFDALLIKSSVTELLRTSGCEDEYLHLNLRSILLNIESMKTKNEK